MQTQQAFILKRRGDFVKTMLRRFVSFTTISSPADRRAKLHDNGKRVLHTGGDSFCIMAERRAAYWWKVVLGTGGEEHCIVVQNEYCIRMQP